MNTIPKMMSNRTAGLSGIVAKMIRAAGVTMIHDLATAIICNGRIPIDWEKSFIVCLHKNKCDTLDRGNYCGLMLMKVLERIMDGFIRQLV